ncbi:hypothetical protein BC830DRAFT_737642 [Chytriomyces sp. MP71]|nr:hypothetical protein BC830DRAFT_737642 [Chytriomyces sp. MP71]
MLCTCTKCEANSIPSHPKARRIHLLQLDDINSPCQYLWVLERGPQWWRCSWLSRHSIMFGKNRVLSFTFTHRVEEIEGDRIVKFDVEHFETIVGLTQGLFLIFDQTGNER